MAITHWHGGKVIMVWLLGLAAGQLLMVNSARPSGALMSITAHLVIPACLSWMTVSWYKGGDSARTSQLTRKNVFFLWAGWALTVGLLHLWIVIWQRIGADTAFAGSMSGSLRLVGWFALVPALVILAAVTWHWFGPREKTRRWWRALRNRE